MSKIKNVYIKLKKKYECHMRRKRIKHTDFSIISNNCWGGLVYQYFDIKYLTPTAGLFIMESDYVKMLYDLKGYMNEDLVFIDPKESRFYDKITKNNAWNCSEITYPVARLRDVEIFFMHYSSRDEAVEKWNRRKKRINYEKLLVKMSERHDSSPKEIELFSKLPFKNKICFTENKYDYPCCVQVDELKRLNKEGGDETPYTLQKIDIYELINNL